MVTRIPEEVLSRAQRMAKRAPEGRGINVRRVSKEPRDWAVEGPKLLGRVAARATALADTVDDEKRAIRQAREDQRHLRERLKGLTDSETYPALTEAVLGAIEDPSSVAEPAAVAVGLLRTRDRLRNELLEIERQLDVASDRAEEERARTSGDAKRLERRIASLQEELGAAEAAQLATSVEQEEVELHYSRARRRLQDLRATVGVILAHVEQDRGPLEATRLYHRFREATHYVEYRREAEEANLRARALQRELDEHHATFQQLLSDYETLVEEVKHLQAVCQDKDEDLQVAWRNNEQLDHKIGQLQGIVDDLSFQVAGARPINVELPAAVHMPLIRQGLLTYGQVAQRSRSELLSIDGLASSRVSQIEEALARVGLSLRTEHQ